MSYAKTTISTVISESADYSSPVLDTGEIAITSTPLHHFRHVVSVPVGGVEGHSATSHHGYKLDLSDHHLGSTPTSLMIRNTNSSGNLHVSWTAHKETLNPEVDIEIFNTANLTSHGGTSLFKIENSGVGTALADKMFNNAARGDFLMFSADTTSMEQKNDRLFLVYDVADDRKSVRCSSIYEALGGGTPVPAAEGVNDGSMSSGADDRLYLLRRNHQTIGPGQFLHIPGNLFESKRAHGNTDLDLQKELHEVHCYGETVAVKTEIVWLE